MEQRAKLASLALAEEILLKPGTLIANKYQIEHLIAEGGMAQLYLAKCVAKEATLEFVAIKRLLPDLRNIESHVELFHKEAQYIITIRSPYIARGLELISEGQELLLVMEYILGSQISDLSLMLKKQRLNIRIQAAVAVGIAIARALKCIRDWPTKGGATLELVHGDISGQNIILSIDGQVKLIDFGLANSSSQQPHENEWLRGTVRYMSPEQRQGRALNQASDIYSLALVLEEIIQEKVCTHELNSVLKKAKAYDLDRRYHSADNLLVELERISLSFGAWDPQAFLQGVLDYQPEAQSFFLSPKVMARLVSLGGALVLIAAMVIATGSRYFYPRIPDFGLDDHHCENYSEDLVGAHNL